MLLGLCLLSGLSYLAGAQPPNSVEATMPGWLVVAWYMALAVGGAVGILGNLWPGYLVVGLQIRLSGQIVTAGPAAAFAVAAVSFAGAPASFAAAIVMGFAISCLWTAKYLIEDIRIIREPR